jgi:hypothetical protein
MQAALELYLADDFQEAARAFEKRQPRVPNLVFSDVGVAAWLGLVRSFCFGCGTARQEFINCLQAAPLIPVACALESFIACC